MAAWSGLCRAAGQILLRNSPSLGRKVTKNESVLIRCMSDHHPKFPFTPSRWYWHKTKDLVHLYVCVAGIPIVIIIFCLNIFIGPAQLAPIPEGYEPKEWEYHRHPLTRFLCRYIFLSEQQEYEKYLHHLWYEYELMKVRKLESQVLKLMQKRVDYQHLYYQPFTNAKYIRKTAQAEKDENELYSGTFDD